MIDGAKALAAGIKKVLGDDAVVQRCRLRKRRNVAGHLPKELAGTIDKRLALIFAQPDADKELDAAKRLANELEADRGSLGSARRSIRAGRRGDRSTLSHTAGPRGHSR